MPAEPAELLIDDPEAGELTFRARVSGPEDGVPVLLLHGWPQTCRSWDAVTPLLAARGLRCAAVDQRGYSPQARPVGTSAYRLDRLVADAEAFLDALGWDRAHVVGHDWGAAVAWDLAARRPGLVRTLTALSIPHPAALMATMADDEEQRGRLAYMDVLRADGNVAERVLLADEGARLRDVYAGAIPDDVVASYVAEFTAPGAMTAALEWYRAMDVAAWAAVPDVEVPTTYVWGDRDIAVTAAAAARCGGHVHAEYALVTLAGRGHWLPEEAPGEVAEAILARVLDG